MEGPGGGEDRRWRGQEVGRREKEEAWRRRRREEEASCRDVREEVEGGEVVRWEAMSR